MNLNGVINILNDIDYQDISKLRCELNINSIQFYQFDSPSLKTWETLNYFYEENPSIALAINWYNAKNLDFLDHLPNLKKLSIKTFNINDFSKVASLELNSLLIGETKSTMVDISFIKDLRKLEILSIDGMKKGLENIHHLNNLWSLNLRGIKTDNIDWVGDLTKLELLKIMYGSYIDTTGLQHLKNLKYLGISRTKGFEDISFLNNLENMEFLHLEGISYFESLPYTNAYKWLKKIKIENLKSLQDISALIESEQLVEFLIYFPGTIKKQIRDIVLFQAFDLINKLPHIKYTNLCSWPSFKKEINQLSSNSIHEYKHSKSKWRQDVEGGWTL
jgi:hypothetical protein